MKYTLTKNETILCELPKTLIEKITGKKATYITNPKKNTITETTKNTKTISNCSLTSVEIPLTTHLSENDKITFLFKDSKGTEHKITIPTNIYDLEETVLKQCNPTVFYDTSITGFIETVLKDIYNDENINKKLELYTAPIEPEPETPTDEPTTNTTNGVVFNLASVEGGITIPEYENPVIPVLMAVVPPNSWESSNNDIKFVHIFKESVTNNFILMDSTILTNEDKEDNVTTYDLSDGSVLTVTSVVEDNDNVIGLAESGLMNTYNVVVSVDSEAEFEELSIVTTFVVTKDEETISECTLTYPTTAETAQETEGTEEQQGE